MDEERFEKLEVSPEARMAILEAILALQSALNAKGMRAAVWNYFAGHIRETIRIAVGFRWGVDRQSKEWEHFHPG